MAVKVIDKLRFPTKQESQLRNEVAILQVTTGLWAPALPPPRKDFPFPLPPFRASPHWGVVREGFLEEGICIWRLKEWEGVLRPKVILEFEFQGY